MVKLINKTTGTPMWVADERADEYKAAGHILAAKPVEKPVVKKAEIPVEVESKPAKKGQKRGK